MAKFGVLIYKSNQKKDGSFPVCLRITKDGKRKYIDLGLTAKEDQWNEETARFKKDKRVNPNHEKYNTLLNHYEERKDVILRKFAENRIDWTLNQFEEEFLGVSKRGKVYDYFLKQIDILKATNHINITFCQFSIFPFSTFIFASYRKIWARWPPYKTNQLVIMSFIVNVLLKIMFSYTI